MPWSLTLQSLISNDAGIRVATNSGGPSVLIAYGCDDMAETLCMTEMDGHSSGASDPEIGRGGLMAGSDRGTQG